MITFSAEREEDDNFLNIEHPEREEEEVEEYESKEINKE